MIEALPIKVLRDEDSQIFGKFNVTLAKLLRASIEIPNGIVVSPPIIQLKTALNYYDLKSKELYEQNLVLIKNKVKQFPLPESLSKELKGKVKFLIGEKVLYSQKEVWEKLLQVWFDAISQKLLREGFSPELAQNLPAVSIFFVQSPKSCGSAYYDEFLENVVVKSTYPVDLDMTENIKELVKNCDKKLLIPHQYLWLFDKTLKLVGVSPYIQSEKKEVVKKEVHEVMNASFSEIKQKVATKVFLNLSASNTQEVGVDGIFIASEKLIDKIDPKKSLDDLIIKILQLVERSDLPILFKLADIPEQVGGVRGALRLIHQKSLMEVMTHILTFIRHKKSISNLHVVIPFVRTAQELIAIKQELAIKKIIRKPSLKIWMEVAVPENITNIEDYVTAGIDGVVLNLDELIAHLYGFDHLQEDMSFYKKEVNGLIKFLDLGLKELHKAKIPVLVYGELLANTSLLEFLVEHWVWGIIVDGYEATSMTDLLYQIEKKIVLKRSS
ncbi:MAG: hypothetical protein Q7R49_01280 [Candidatus Daviesbacteria bacterium]|nr:hypothetical protein [Candidatus Daviesbacteria bacterium]